MGLRDLAAFLTALPLGGGSLEGAARSYPLTPIVGLLVGLAAWAAGAPAAAESKPLLAAALYTAAHVALTGGLHLDGLADLADALAAGARGGEALRILKDPRRGSAAIVAVTTVLITQTAAAAAVYAAHGPLHSLAPLTLSHILSYESMYIASATLPPPPHQGLGRTFWEHGAKPPKARLKNIAALTATLTPTAALTALTTTPQTLALEATGWLATLTLTLRKTRQTPGYANGDVLGYTQEITRTGTLLATALTP